MRLCCARTQMRGFEAIARVQTLRLRLSSRRCGKGGSRGFGFRCRLLRCMVDCFLMEAPCQPRGQAGVTHQAQHMGHLIRAPRPVFHASAMRRRALRVSRARFDSTNHRTAVEDVSTKDCRGDADIWSRRALVSLHSWRAEPWQARMWRSRNSFSSLRSAGQGSQRYSRWA
jgi:hypothetical protein